MALKGKTKLVQSKHAKTQYMAIPAAIVGDSQYPFEKDEEVEITVEPNRRRITIVSAKKTPIKTPS